MKQKLFLGALLLGALTLNSCVDDTESASVTAVRQAKAEQLKSLAAYNDAQAKALIMAEETAKAAQEAEAGLKKAQEEYYKAQAAYQQAMADYQAAQTETERANAQKALADAEKSKAEAAYWTQYYANEIQNLKDQLEIDIINNKKDLLEAQQKYEAAILKGDQERAAALITLLGDYQRANNNLLKAQQDLAGYRIDLAQLEAGLVSPLQTLKDQIRTKKNDIADWKKDNLEAQAYLDTWEKYTSADAQKELDAVKIELISLNKAKTEADKAKTAAYNKYGLAKEALTKSNFTNAINELKGSGYMHVQVQLVNSLSAPKDALGKYCAVTTDWNTGIRTYVPLFGVADTDSEEIKYNLENKEYTSTQSYDVYTEYYPLVDGGLDKYVAALQAELEAGKAEGSSLANAIKDYDDAVKAEEAAKTTKTTLETLIGTWKAAKKAYDERPANSTAEATAALKKTMDDALKAIKTEADKADLYFDADAAEPDTDQLLADAQNAIDRAVSATANDLSSKNYWENDYASSEAQVKEIEEWVATAKKEAAGVPDAMKACNDASKANAEAIVAYNEADNAVTLKNAEQTALNTLINNASSIDTQVADKKTIIETNNKLIANAEYEIEKLEAQLEDGKYSTEKAISNIKAQIEQKEAEISELEEEVKIRKALLDAAMESDEPVNPAPAE